MTQRVEILLCIALVMGIAVLAMYLFAVPALYAGIGAAVVVGVLLAVSLLNR